MTLRTGHENPEIKTVYEAFYGHPLSEMAEKCFILLTAIAVISFNERKKRR